MDHVWNEDPSFCNHVSLSETQEPHQKVIFWLIQSMEVQQFPTCLIFLPLNTCMVIYMMTSQRWEAILDLYSTGGGGGWSGELWAFPQVFPQVSPHPISPHMLDESPHDIPHASTNLHPSREVVFHPWWVCDSEAEGNETWSSTAHHTFQFQSWKWGKRS